MLQTEGVFYFSDLSTDEYQLIETPDIVCIGHFCHDEVYGRMILGGTTSYCAIVAAQLGSKAGVITSVGPDFLFRERFEELGIEVMYKTAENTTVFKNIYHDGQRTQYLKARAGTLLPDDLPRAWQKAPIVKFCLIADEVDPSVLGLFPGSLVGATIQGWLRKWDSQGKISAKEMDWTLLSHIDVISMSRDDIAGFEHVIPQIASTVSVLVITDGHKQAEVFVDGLLSHYPAFPVIEVDPTGAGDVFAASFLLKYGENRNIDEAVSFAHCAASIVVEGVGLDKLSDLHLIEERVTLYKQMYL